MTLHTSAFTPTFLRFLLFDILRFSYSHSIVAGGLELMSSTTRLTPRTSLMMRLDMTDSVS